MLATVGTDLATKDWIRGPSDEMAVRNGCRFDGERGRYVVDWIQKYCKLYEGEMAGQPLMLKDWQLECTMRMFGWVRWSKQWAREVRRFRSASIWVAKKNKKSPTLAAWGLYLMCGDGEPGQKVYLAAKDGQQARDISGKHVFEMVIQSRELSSECKTNLNKMQIVHTPSRSLIVPLSSANSRTQEAKEGLNGCVLVDETHVVDRAFISRISRAGISRPEPMHIEVSTAGNNPDGYGKERFSYADEVLRGVVEDQGLFVAIYAAPQDLSDSDLDADPLKYARMANPAMDHTVDPEEVLEDYTRSRRTLSGLNDFKMYRLNIWQNSASPWLRSGDWELCGADFTESDMVGLPCWAALDLSRTDDMSSLTLTFPLGEGKYRLLTYFWMPEDRAREYNNKASFLKWAKDGYLILTPGSVVDYGYIKAAIKRLAAILDIQELTYDPMYAGELTQAIEQGVADDTGAVIEEGIGLPRVEFPQTIMNFAGPTAEFERLVLAQLIEHNRNPVMTWQIGNANVKTDVNGNKRPVKPDNADYRKIDGVVSAIMGLSRTMLAEVEPAFNPGVA